MAETKIEWTGTKLPTGTILPGYTFNGWIGCSKISAGCKNCYAERDMDHRFGRVKWGEHGTRQVTAPAYWAKPLQWNKQAAAAGWRRKVFAFSLADWLEERDELIHPRALLLELIAATPWLDWLLLSKRVEGWEDRITEISEYNLIGAAEIANRWLDGKPPANVWLGTSAEDQDTADHRFPRLLEVPAVLHFVSLEPLLGAIDFQLVRDLEGFETVYDTLRGVLSANGQLHLPMPSIKWVIAGGESGPRARPTHLLHAQHLRDQCVAAGVPFFWKQWGEWQSGPIVPDQHFGGGAKVKLSGCSVAVDSNRVRRLDDQHAAVWLGRDRAGHHLEGTEWRQWPEEFEQRAVPGT